MVRRQAGEVIPAKSAKFDDLMGMTWKGKDGFEGFYETYVLGCERWKSGTPMIRIDRAAKALGEAQKK